MLQPKSPRPTTHIPMTEPPEKAIDSARFMPDSSAAFAVLTFAFVATFIPKKPASTENSAPTKKHTAVPQLMKTPISTTSAATKKTRILYSALRNASAPSAIAEAISCILAFPGDERIT